MFAFPGRTRRHPRWRLAVALLALAAASVASAQWPGQRLPPVPESAYPGDRVFVPLPGGGLCNVARLDPARPPQIRLVRHVDNLDFDTHYYELRYWLKNADSPICGVPPGPPIYHAGIGTLPRGVHYFTVTGYVDDVEMGSYESGNVVGAQRGLPPDVSGLWSNPAQPGRGLSVMPIGGLDVTMIWYTQGGDGAPLWMVATGTSTWDDMHVEADAQVMRAAPLGTGPTTPQVDTWGRLRFSYVRCGVAQLDWTPADPTLAAGSVTLTKLAQSTHESRCLVHADVQAQWIDAR